MEPGISMPGIKFLLAIYSPHGLSCLCKPSIDLAEKYNKSSTIIPPTNAY